ncbi:killer cell lectin-like receptor subfamily G member 1 isoform X2 [Bufo gargarizans]|uniref:killer cell lectin-like receptor subfamily G member 1 isoform X2 n=1 Tax=Bufo gargarizans TaxID=30331 RepID=UPI001CF59A76|nr:killer cell lectin-like receptor subfamily G member 1 isoform X2 [Bufo gargarizans]
MAENITYAEMNLTFGKGKGQGKTNSDSAGGDDITVTRAALKKTTKKKGRKCEDQEGQCVEKSTWDKCVIVREDEERTDWKHRVLRGRHCSLLPIPFLVILCLILLITTITSRTSCTTSDGSRSGPSSSSDLFSPCPDPWILVTRKCYFFSENRKNRKDSKEDCEKRNSSLATVKEGTILKLVNITEQEFWIGLEDLGTYHQDKPWSGRWADGSTQELPKGSGNCAKMKGGLHLHNCQSDLHWICEKEISAQ